MNFWQGKHVFLTGHTGFKGAWLALWLKHLGAHVTGYALAPDSTPNLFDYLKIDHECRSIIADLGDLAALDKAVHDTAPDIVIHMAAQSLVRRSYREPLATIAANVTGTAHLLEACRDVKSIRSIVVVTTDKCYRNDETGRPYGEDDPLGGHDLYSASKAAAEIVAHGYRQSFFDAAKTRIATARAGNVIGGGDFAEDRLIPDAVRAFMTGGEMIVRSPDALRPWQHVTQPLSGYLALAQTLYENTPHSPAYNFGPDADAVVPVKEVMKRFARCWGNNAAWRIDAPKDAPHEAHLLALDSTLAHTELEWKPRLSLDEAIAATAEGYQLLLRDAPHALKAHMLALCDKAL